jgi:hypothetical protein
MLCEDLLLRAVSEEWWGFVTRINTVVTGTSGCNRHIGSTFHSIFMCRPHLHGALLAQCTASGQCKQSCVVTALSALLCATESHATHSDPQPWNVILRR